MERTMTIAATITQRMLPRMSNNALHSVRMVTIMRRMPTMKNLMVMLTIMRGMLMAKRARMMIPAMREPLCATSQMTMLMIIRLHLGMRRLSLQ
jgi:hypothetical protein